MTLGDRFRKQAAGCDRMRAPLYGVLLRGMADDWDAGGLVRDICAGWEDTSESDAVHLRFLGGLHRLVLVGQAPALVPYYRNLGGTLSPAGAWDVAADVVSTHADRLRRDLEIVPQTNEVGRTAALVMALYRAVARTGLNRVRLLEVGASAGLNLRFDRYRITSGSWAWGPVDSPVRIDGPVHGPFEPVSMEIVARRGCDLDPIDPRTEEGRLRLRSFVWPDNVERFRRLEGALEVATQVPAIVDRSAATPWLAEHLAEPVDDDVLTVVWHSLVWMYLRAGERRAAEDVMADAAARRRLVHARMEPIDLRWAGRTFLSMTTYDDGTAQTATFGRSHPHGMPLRLSG